MANELSVTVKLDKEAQEDLVTVMSSMEPKDEAGEVRSITMPVALRHALHETAKRLGRGKR